MLFFNFSLFLFFQIENDYCQKAYGKTILFYNRFRGFLWSSTRSQIFLIYTLLTLKRRPFLRDCILFFLNEKNIATSLLVIRLKCTVVYYANLNSSSINKPYLQAVEYTISFLFLFLIYVYFNEAFVKNFLKNYYFLIEISKIHLKM